MFGRLLYVDLSSGSTIVDTVPESYVQEYIGGSGLGARMLWDLLDPAREPLDPQSPLIWVTGPLTGSAGPATGRFTLCARSPQTGLWGESNIGGFVGPELRFAGFDALVITGRAAAPVYLWIHNQEVELRSAAHLWGKTDIYTTQQAIKNELDEPRARVACIGAAGENGVPFASIGSDHGRFAARTGMGALMGSKNLKAVAVRGTGRLPLAKLEEYRSLALASNKALLDHNMTAVLHETGTSGSADYLEYLGDMPQKYWTQAAFQGAEKIGGATMAETILAGTSTCQGCVIACGRVVEIKGGPYATRGRVKGPEYETICSFGSQLLVDDLAQITALGERCDRLGMDTISAGNTIALAYLLYERGLISRADTGGLELRWGDARPCFELLEQMAYRRGFGALLAEGSLALASHYGVPELAAQVHNLEVPMHDPRANTGQGLAYLTSPRGACHNQSDFFIVETGGAIEELGIPMTDRFANHGKAHIVARHQDYRTVFNSLVVCFFAFTPVQGLVEMLSAALGHDWSLEEMMLAGERAWNLKRIANLRLGLNPMTEKLPKLLLEPLPGGGQKGRIPDMEMLLNEYYTARGWDRKTGWPTGERLTALDLEFTRKEIHPL
jgi:aldehyde:ferredoxin oxidoreductase